MQTTHETGDWIKFLVFGAIAGIIAAIVMAMYAMIATATYLHLGFFSPLYAIAAPLIGRQTLMASMHDGTFYFAAGPAVLGAVVHMMFGALFGIIFGLIARPLHLTGVVAVMSGMVYALLVMLLMSFIVIPLVHAPNMPATLGWGTFTIMHLLFGLVVGFWSVVQPQYFTNPPMRQAA
jgi:uncharacterized membrane protein YagU involved in acid resistance